MAGKSQGIAVLISVLVVTSIFGIVGGLWAAKSFGLIGQTTVPGGTGGTGGTGGSGDGGTIFFCDQNPAVDLQARSKNLEVTTANQYDNVTVMVKNTKSGILQSYDIDNAQGQGGDRFDTFADAITCGEPYQIVYRATRTDDVSGYSTVLAGKDTLVDPIKVDGNSWTVSYLRAKVFDVDINDWMFANSSAQGGVDRTTTYMNLGFLTNFTNASSSPLVTMTGKAVNADETYHVRIHIKTNSTDAVGGIKNWVAVDYLDDNNNDDWQKPIVSVDGVALSDIRGELDPNDILALNTYEAVYDLGKSIKETDSIIDFTAISGSGVNPDKDFVLRFVGTGYYTDDKTTNSIIGFGDNTHGRGFRTDTSRTEMLYGTAQTMRLVIDNLDT